MIAPETLAAALRVAQHGARRAMLAARGDAAAPAVRADSLGDTDPDTDSGGHGLQMPPGLPVRHAEAQRPGA